LAATKVACKKNLKTLLNATFVQFICLHFNCIITVEVGRVVVENILLTVFREEGGTKDEDPDISNVNGCGICFGK
jgi:hypothetical protein